MSGLKECCVAGARHTGTPKGSIEKFDGVDVYVATPKGDYAKDTAILFLPDVFGITLENAQLLADDFAENGYKTFLIDYLNGDPLPPDALNSGMGALEKWFPNHGAEQTTPTLLKAVEALKKQGITKFGATGYCFGGKYTVVLAEKGYLTAGVLNHPSLLELPDDLETLKKANLPVLFNTCENDFMYGQDKQAEGDKIFQGYDKYKRNYWEKNDHGFAVRADLSKPECKKAKEEAFEAAVEWFKKYL